jgi:hypothetical protein
VRSYTSNVYDILVDQGATLSRAMFLKTSSKSPISLDGYSGRMHIRDYVTSSVIIETLTTENGQMTITPASGRVDILLSPAETAALAVKKYVYDIELESPEGEVTKVLSGKLTVRAEITY